MRVIKFRAWDSQKAVMLDDTNNIGVFDGDVFQAISSSDMELVPDAIPLQFTGALDKNGVEIYEGDILRWADNFKDDVSERIFEYIEPVEYHDSAFYFRNHWGSSVGEIIKDEQELVEVIGNIYENPELIGEQR